VTTFNLLRWASVPAATIALFSLAACSGGESTAAPRATVTVTATPSAAETTADPSAGSTPVAEPTEEDERPPISATPPPIFGDAFQSDPGHDFTKGISPSRDGILRGQLRTMQDANVAEYVPVRRIGGAPGQTGVHFEGPQEGDITAFAAPIAENVVFLSAIGCDGKDQTINDQYLGTQTCSRDQLISRADKGDLYALITVKGSEIVKVAEIYTS
jgi:hypothetical protein